MKKDINLMVGRFQPFTLGHIKGAQEVMNKYNLRTDIDTLYMLKKRNYRNFNKIHEIMDAGIK